MAHQRTSHCKHLLLTTGHCTRHLLQALFQTWKDLAYMLQIHLELSSTWTRIRSHLQIFEHGHTWKDTAGFRNQGETPTYNIPCQFALNRLPLKVDRATAR